MSKRDTTRVNKRMRSWTPITLDFTRDFGVSEEGLGHVPLQDPVYSSSPYFINIPYTKDTFGTHDHTYVGGVPTGVTHFGSHSKSL